MPIACAAPPAAEEAPVAAAASAEVVPEVPASQAVPAKLSAPGLVALDVAPLLFNLKPEELSAACARLETVAEAKLTDLIAVANDKRTFANTVGALEHSMTDYVDATLRLGFLKDVHQDEKVRAASASCEERMGKFLVAVAARKELYQAVKAYVEGAGQKEALDAQDQRLLAITLRDFKRNGLELKDEQREQLVKIRQRLAELSTQYSRNMDEDASSIEVSATELAGLPEEFIKRLKPTKNGKKLIVTTQYPDYYPVMESAVNPATRKKMHLAFSTRGGKANVKLLEEAVALRDDAAKLLGYATHVDFVTDDRMAKNAATVARFEARMREGVRAKLAEETAAMQALKARETKKAKVSIDAWDWRYYLSQLKKQQYAIDDEQVRKYFPSDRVFSGMFELYSALFGVVFTEVQDAAAWAPLGVKLYETRERLEDGSAGKLLAKFYVDLYPRPGKYGHAACFTLGQARVIDAQGTLGYQVPLSALVTNFNPPESGKPSYLSVDEVKTLFHEFGHVMHASLTTAKYASLAGSNVATDFVEAPSQMLENWVFERDVLAKISLDPDSKDGGPIPLDLQKRIIAARKFDAGVKYSRQVFLGTFDYRIHSSGRSVDTVKVANTEWAAIMGFAPLRGELFPASFGHMMGGYDAGYYGYLWSEVFAVDMFSRFEKEGVLNTKTGRDYRDTILALGRTEDPDVLLERFLGRAPNEAAFIKQLGLAE